MQTYRAFQIWSSRESAQRLAYAKKIPDRKDPRPGTPLGSKGESPLTGTLAAPGYNDATHRLRFIMEITLLSAFAFSTLRPFQGLALSISASSSRAFPSAISDGADFRPHPRC